MAPHDKGRPNGAAFETPTKKSETNSSRSDAQAGYALRCAWLRVHADELRSVDPSGLLSAQLRDFADLLELVQSRGWE